MEKFDFLEWAIKNGYGKIEIPSNTLGLILKFENHVNSEVKKLNIPCAIKSVCLHEPIDKDVPFPICKHCGEMLF